MTGKPASEVQDSERMKLRVYSKTLSTSTQAAGSLSRVTIRPAEG